MKRTWMSVSLLALATVAGAAEPAGISVTMSAPVAPAGESIADVARALAVRHKTALVQVSGVLKIEGMPGQMEPAEQPLETIGTVVDASGLTVVSATTVNPINLLKNMSRQMAQQSEAGMGGDDQSSIKVAPGQLKIRRADGTETAAVLVLQDEDLDLAFLMPESAGDAEKPAACEFVSMAGGQEARVMDEVIGIGQLGKMFNWEVSAGLSRVMAKTVKPRTFYALAPGYTGGPGTPVFSAAGRPVGLVVLRSQSGELMDAPVILPAADVLEMAAEARKAAVRRQEAKAKTVEARKTDTPASKENI